MILPWQISGSRGRNLDGQNKSRSLFLDQLKRLVPPRPWTKTMSTLRSWGLCSTWRPRGSRDPVWVLPVESSLLVWFFRGRKGSVDWEFTASGERISSELPEIPCDAPSGCANKLPSSSDFVRLRWKVSRLNYAIFSKTVSLSWTSNQNYHVCNNLNLL